MERGVENLWGRSAGSRLRGEVWLGVVWGMWGCLGAAEGLRGWGED